MSREQRFRLPAGGLIDRSRVLRFTWAGRRLEGFAGDTLASALLANGVRLVGRSFKLHRPRGLIGAGVEEANVLVQLGEGARTTPNVRATEIALYDGLVARPVNCWPGVRFDAGGIAALAARFLPAGFYYKTFMWPNWHLYEGIIRRAAGLGRAPDMPDPDRYESCYAHCDVLVVGGGPAGLAAARAAAASGARVMLVEQDDILGGSLLHDRGAIDGADAVAWTRAASAALSGGANVRTLLRTTAIAYQDDNLLTLYQRIADEMECADGSHRPRGRLWMVRAKRVVLATGAIERPLVFPGNDRPGIMLAAASRTYLRRYAVLPGRRAVLYANNDDAYRTAFALSDAGCNVAAVVDIRSSLGERLRQDVADRGIRLIVGGEITGTRGAHAVRRVLVRHGGELEWIRCDHLAMSGGFNPATHLFSQSGGQVRYDERLAAFVPGASVAAERSVGAAAGVFGMGDGLAQGDEAGREAAMLAGFAAGAPIRYATKDADDHLIKAHWATDKAAGKAFVDFQNDVTTDDIVMAVHENYRSVEHLKRYTTLGMAPDQGKTSNVNAVAILAHVTGRGIAETGQTRFRYPFTPTPLAAFGGRAHGALFRPLRHMPAHDRHVAARAVLEDYGGWARPSHYLRAGENARQAEQREALAVRTAAGVFEASPLGKIEVSGPDAGRFLDLVYANTMSTLKIGKVRYGLMLDERGVIIDDGVTTRLDEACFLVGTSSAGADRIAAWMEEWLQCEWPYLDVRIVPVTPAWGVLTLTGPKAREILARAGASPPLLTMSHMCFGTGEVGGIPARVFRVSFTGEISYEINVPARRTRALWDTLFEAGRPLGLEPVGIDAWMVLRTEKGFLHVGGDTDGTTTALDVGWSHILKKDNDFIGRRSLLRAGDQRPDRLQFIGLAVSDDAPVLPIGSPIVRGEGTAAVTEGHVTSAGYSPSLCRPVALAMLSGGRARLGETVRVETAAGVRGATVVDPAIYDPSGERLRG